MNNTTRLKNLTKLVQKLYEQKNEDLLFHGWRHILFVVKKSQEFALSLGADLFLVQSAALLHDVNYFFERNSAPNIGAELRKSVLTQCGYTEDEVKKIESIILEAHTAYRNETISTEGKALSDADSLFKVLPITPVIFANRYITENKITIKTLANKIVSEQNKLMEAGIFFYSTAAIEKYQEWAIVNLKLWNCILASLDDPSVIELLSDLG